MKDEFKKSMNFHRLSKVAKELNVSMATLSDFLRLKGYKIDSNPNAKITNHQYIILLEKYTKDKNKPESNVYRLSKVAKELNIGMAPLSEFLRSRGFKVDSNPNAKITNDLYIVLLEKYAKDKNEPESNVHRLSKVAKELRIGVHTFSDFLNSNGYKVEANPNAKITNDLYTDLLEKYSKEKERQDEIRKKHKVGRGKKVQVTKEKLEGEAGKVSYRTSNSIWLKNK